MTLWALAVLCAACQCDRPRVQRVIDAGLVCDIEICGNDRDDNCDGQVDEGCPCSKVSADCECIVGGPTQPCGPTQGACRAGQQLCGLDGRWGTCSGGTQPTVETCDGLDNDCDGETDEGLSRACGSSVGTCRQGQQQCELGVFTGCVGETAPGTELCEGRLDENCDGMVDEGCACALGQTRLCGSTVGTCRQGTQLCDARGQWGTCVGGVQPVAEVCDSLDNDCDGTTDGPSVCRPPLVSCPASSNASVGAPTTLTATASSPAGIVSTAWTVTMSPTASTAAPATPAALSTTFTPDQVGPFTVSFCATDGDGSRSCCTTTLNTGSACASPPPPPVSTACGTSWDGRPIVQFAQVPSGLVYELTEQGRAAVLATATVGQNYLRPMTRVAPGGPVPGVPVSLTVRACRTADPTCCSSATPVSVSVVESCTTPVPPTIANIVLSEYIVTGEGSCSPSMCDQCQAGEAVEITNLSNCPVSLDGFHFAYRNNSASSGSLRWMNFTPVDIIPPRGVYVAIRNRQNAPTCSASLPMESTGLYGLKISTLAMQGPNLCSGWFNNTGGGQSELRLANGTIAATGAPTFTPSAAIARIAPYLSSGGTCTSIGFDAVDSCGTVMGGTQPNTILMPNQLGRLWHPCDRVLAPVPACVRN
jgi:hypothetical protein